MSVRQTRQRTAREWLVALLSYAILVAPFGCQLQDAWLGGGGLGLNSAGLFLNQDATDPLIVAGRNAAGDAFFVFGTRQSNGAVGEVDSIIVETAAGQRSFILFEKGRPVYAQGPDGSSVQVTYEEVSAQRLAATAKIYNAATGKTETVSADVDLQKTAAEVAAAVEQLTGHKLVVPELPPQNAAKLLDRAGVLSTALAVVPLFLLGQLMVVIMGQVAAVLYDAVTAAVQVAVLAALTPVFLLASLLGEVTVRMESLPLLEVFIELPPRPLVEVVIQ